MSDAASAAISALAGAAFDGLVQVQEMGVQGMITLRTSADNPQLAEALRDVAGLDLPDQRGIVASGETALAWMSPDEWLILLPHAQAHEAVARLRRALEGTHHLVENVSDARALFALTGDDDAVREVLAKLSPVDLHPDRFGPGEMRRTRLAQVPGAIWMPQAGQARVVCFRSVARYVFDLLSVAAAPGSAVDHFG